MKKRVVNKKFWKIFFVISVLASIMLTLPFLQLIGIVDVKISAIQNLSDEKRQLFSVIAVVGLLLSIILAIWTLRKMIGKKVWDPTIDPKVWG